ncbi:MAG: hypothetical protein Q8P07_00975 [bacterium]|nr:hypothetical protein [bacterium]
MVDSKELFEFLRKARKEEELLKKFSISKNDLRKVLRRPIKGYDLFPLYNTHGEMLYRYCALPEKLEIKPRIWRCVLSEDERIPYQVVNFPDNIDWKRITIVPLYDIQWGSTGNDEKKLDEYIRFIEKTENAFGFFGGDILQNALINSPGGSVFDQIIRPKEQGPTFIKKFQPIAHKILWAFTGNHEARTEKVADINPLNFVCRDMGIPYFDQPVYTDINWKGHTFRFFTQHGTSGAGTPGGRVNAAMRPVIFTEFTNFYIMGHVNDVFTNPNIRVCRERIYEVKKGKKVLKEIRLIEREQYIVIAPSFETYHGTYAARAALTPFATGDVSCRLNADGSYEVTE